MNSRRSRQAAPHAGFMVAVCLTLMAPVFFSGRTLGPDWTNHLWLVSVQSDAISNGGPTLFAHSDAFGVFYPFFAFYGGTLYAIAGALSAALGGQPLIAYVVMWFFGLLMAYGGMLWLSFQAGLRGWQAHAAPVVVVTAAYYMTNAYQRGTWPELMAVSAIPLLLASAVSILRAPRVAFGPAAAFVVATIVFTGSHNITLLWGTIAIGALALVAVATVPSLRRFPRRQVLALLGLGALGVAVSAWFLLPDLAYSNRTLISGPRNSLSFVAIDWFATPGNVFSLWRHTTPVFAPKYALYTQLPLLVLVWAVVAGGFSLKAKVNARVLQVAAGLVAVIVLFGALLMLKEPWRHMPRPLTLIQFTFRLESYIIIALGLLIAVLLRATNLWRDRSPRIARALELALVVALVFGFGQAVWQSWGPGTSSGGSTRAQATHDPQQSPPGWTASTDYRDRSAKVFGGPPPLDFDPKATKGDRVTITVTGTGARATNVPSGPYLAKVSGARELGRTPEGFQVVQPVAHGNGPIKLGVEPALTAPVVLGRWISIAALVALLGLALAGAYRALAGRRDQS
jgi:hypothetical protein